MRGGRRGSTGGVRSTRMLVLAALLGTVLGAAAPAPPAAGQPGQGVDWAEQRHRMVEEQIKARGITQPEVLSAMDSIPRHLFVPDAVRDEAYADHPLPIDYGQTISQPYIVALMTELLDLRGPEKVLEIGTGSGYHSAVLSRVAGEVYTIEIIEPLGRKAASILDALGFHNVHVRIGDGYKGWPEKAPFDAIILTAAPPRPPQPLIDQLKVGGRMVVPVGDFLQDLRLIVKTEDGIETRADRAGALRADDRRGSGGGRRKAVGPRRAGSISSM